jgi:hypothetical protein
MSPVSIRNVRNDGEYADDGSGYCDSVILEPVLCTEVDI